MSYTPAASEVKNLREATGAGMMDCKRALTETQGDLDAAKNLLRTWGLAGVQKRSGRTAGEGGIFQYIHQIDPDLPAKIGVIVELNCETDFVAKTDDFKTLGKNIAMHIAAMEPRWVSKEEVPDDFLEQEKKILLDSDAVRGKPENVVGKIVEGKINSILSDKGGVLLEQPYIRDESGKQTVGALVTDVAASVKENVVVRRFVRYRLGEGE